MKKILWVIGGCACLALVWCYSPYTVVHTVSVRVFEQDGYPSDAPAKIVFKDAADRALAEANAEVLDGYWYGISWSAETHPLSTEAPAQVKSVTVETKACGQASALVVMTAERRNPLIWSRERPSYQGVTVDISLTCPRASEQLHRIATIKLHTALFEALEEGIHYVGKGKRLTGADFEKLDTTFPAESASGDNIRYEIFNPRSSLIMQRGLSVGLDTVVEGLSPELRPYALNPLSPLSLAIYRKMKPYGIEDLVVGIIGDMESRICRKWSEPKELETVPSSGKLSDGAIEIPSGLFDSIVTHRAVCVKDKASGRVYQYVRILDRTKVAGGEWNAAWMHGIVSSPLLPPITGQPQSR